MIAFSFKETVRHVKRSPLYSELRTLSAGLKERISDGVSSQKRLRDASNTMSSIAPDFFDSHATVESLRYCSDPPSEMRKSKIGRASCRKRVMIVSDTGSGQRICI